MKKEKMENDEGKKRRGKRKNRTYQTLEYSNKLQPTVINSNITIVRF